MRVPVGQVGKELVAIGGGDFVERRIRRGRAAGRSGHEIAAHGCAEPLSLVSSGAESWGAAVDCRLLPPRRPALRDEGSEDASRSSSSSSSAPTPRSLQRWMNCVSASGSSVISKTGKTFSRSPSRNNVIAAPARRWPYGTRSTDDRSSGGNWAVCSASFALTASSGAEEINGNRISYCFGVGHGQQPGDARLVILRKLVNGIGGGRLQLRRIAFLENAYPGAGGISWRFRRDTTDRPADAPRWTRPVARPESDSRHPSIVRSSGA